MKLTSLLQLVDKLQQAGKIDNLQQAVAFLAAYLIPAEIEPTVQPLGPVHMGRSCLGCRENISTGQIILFCSYGREMFSRLPGKVCRCVVDFVKCKQKVFPLSGKVVFI